MLHKFETDQVSKMNGLINKYCRDTWSEFPFSVSPDIMYTIFSWTGKENSSIHAHNPT